MALNWSLSTVWANLLDIVLKQLGLVHVFHFSNLLSYSDLRRGEWRKFLCEGDASLKLLLQLVYSQVLLLFIFLIKVIYVAAWDKRWCWWVSVAVVRQTPAVVVEKGITHSWTPETYHAPLQRSANLPAELIACPLSLIYSSQFSQKLI